MTIAQPNPTTCFTAAQITAYYNRINLPDQYRHTPDSAAKTLHTNPTAALTFLSLIQKHQVCSIPFENLSLHYSPNPAISTSASHVYDKLITKRRGGYCMENTTLLYNILSSLNFNVYATGGRVLKALQPISPTEEYVGEHWNHMLLLCTLSNNETHLLDAGFSNTSPLSPMHLLHTFEMQNSGLSRVRLMQRDARMWEYQVKFSETSAWLPAYEFSLVPFTSADFVVMSFFTSTSIQSWFTREVVVARMICDDEGRCVGDLTLFGKECKKRVDGESKVVIVCETEEQRVEVLEREFGILLEESEKLGIRGRVSEIL